jgi:hypothetical protein
VAANNRGIQLVGALIKEYGLDVVHAYMTFIQASTQIGRLVPEGAASGQHFGLRQLCSGTRGLSSEVQCCSVH